LSSKQGERNDVRKIVMNDMADSKGILVTGVIGEDVHIMGIRIVEHALRDAGFRIVSLGAQISQEQYIEAAIETNADAILVSSLGGHASILVPGLREKCDEAGLKKILLYLGGQLIIGDMKWEDSVKMFKDMGFDRVYPSDVRLSEVIADLEADCKTRMSGLEVRNKKPDSNHK
jgi:methylaspartate mutase sigma subunit